MHKVETGVFGQLHSFLGRDDAPVGAFGVNKLNAGDADFPVGAGALL